MEKYTVIKYKDKYGYVDIPSKVIQNITNSQTGETIEVSTLNKVITEDNEVKMVSNEDVEVIDDNRSRKFIKEVEKLYSE